MKPMSLPWLTEILAILTILVEAGHLGHVFSSEIAVLIAAVATAIAGFFAALQNPAQAAQLPPPVQPAPKK
jgi:hypothetical protein